MEEMRLILGKNDKEMEKTMGQAKKVIKALEIITLKELCNGQVGFICFMKYMITCKMHVNFMS